MRVYKNHYCKCECGKRIRVPTNPNTLKYYKYRGIPEYINGHSPGGKFKKGHHSPTEFKKGKNNPSYIHGWYIGKFGQLIGIAIDNSLNRGYPYPIFLNEPFKGASFHHFNNEIGIWIPRKLHQSIRHSVKTGKNLDLMNDIAVNWLFENIEG